VRHLSRRGQTRFERRADDIIEQEGAINEESETQNLEPLERLPAQT
jgi:hypothetical protein